MIISKIKKELFNTLPYVLSRVVAEIFEKHGKNEGKSMDKEFEQFYALLQVIRPVIRVRLATEGKQKPSQALWKLFFNEKTNYIRKKLYLCTQVSVVWIITSTAKDMSKISIRLYNDDTIDGKSRNIAYTLWESRLVASDSTSSSRRG